MARPKSAGFDSQREQILAAAAQLFAHQGYTATTMNQVAAGCGVSKATLYHYVQDKHDVLAQIAADHVARLEALVAAVQAQQLPALAHLQALITQFMQAYASAQHQHRVLTEDVKFLGDQPRGQVLGAQRRVVQAFADAVAQVQPELQHAGLHKPLAMLLFGMMNWTFTWMRAQGPLTHAALAALVVDLFLGGLPAVAATGRASVVTGADAGAGAGPAPATRTRR
jgi:AcrR family transcriptional regulator